MIILNKQKLSKIVLNKQKISRAILNGAVVYSEKTPESGIITSIQALEKYKHYFIFLVVTGRPLETYSAGNIAGKSYITTTLKTLLNDLVLGSDTQTSLDIATNPVTIENLSLNELGLKATETSSNGFKTTIYSKGIHREMLKPKNIENRLVYGFLVGQTNLGYFENPLKNVSSKITLAMDNNLCGESAFSAYMYCLRYRGVYEPGVTDSQTSDYLEYKLVSDSSNYTKLSNSLTASFNGQIYNSEWFDGLEATPY